MSATNDGGPAFPPQVVRDGDGLLQEVGVYGMQTGMSLRDYFAAKALPALLDLCRQDCHEGRTYPEHCANNAYEVADAMLKERDK